MVDLALDRPVERPSPWIAGLQRGGARLWLGAALVGVLVLVALLAPLIAPHDPLEQDLMSAQLPPAWVDGGDSAYLLGTDSLGRCVLSRLIYSARTAVAVALIAASLAAVIGIALGLIAGSFGGWVDQVTSRLIDVWMAFPPVLLSIVLAAVIGAGLTSVIAAIVVVDWTRFARVVRADTMVQLQRDYALAARVIGLTLDGLGHAADPCWREVVNVNPRAVIDEISMVRCGYGSNIELFQYQSPDQSKTLPKNSDIGGHHIALYVDDIDKAAAYLKEKNVRTMQGPIPITEGPAAGQSILYFFAPWGLQMELISYPKGMAYEKDAKSVLWSTTEPMK